MEFEKLNLRLKRSEIKKLNPKQKEIYKDILRIGRSITHHKRIVLSLNKKINMSTKLCIYEWLNLTNKKMGTLSCSLCRKYNKSIDRDYRCIGCPLTIADDLFNCFLEGSPFKKLCVELKNENSVGMINVELTKMLPALYHTLENYKGLLDVAK